MFANTITLGTTAYDLTLQRPQSSVRKNALATIGEANSLNIAHEVSKSGLVSSVAFLEQDHLVSVGTTCTTAAPVVSAVRAQFKLTYNPTKGIVDLELELASLRDQLIALIGDSGSWSKFLNTES